MKRILSFAAGLMLLAATTACNSQRKQGEANADSMSVEAETTVEAAQPVFTAEGIAPVTLGAVLAELPEQVEGLYASKQYVEIENPEEADADAVDGWYFYDAEGNVLFTAEDNGKGCVGRVTVKSPAIATAKGAHVGMTAAEIEAVEGIVKDAANPEADYQLTTFTLDDISIALDWEGTAVASMSVERW